MFLAMIWGILHCQNVLSHKTQPAVVQPTDCEERGAYTRKHPTGASYMQRKGERKTIIDVLIGGFMNYKIEYLPVTKLKINPENPRLIRDANFKSLVKSLRDCPHLFDARPCLCSNRTGELIVLAGNMRLLAAKELKYKEVPVIIIPDLTELQEREIVIKDNGSTWGEWDFDLLAAWDSLPLEDWGVYLPEDWGRVVEITEDQSETKSSLQENECPKCGFKWKSSS